MLYHFLQGTLEGEHQHCSALMRQQLPEEAVVSPAMNSSDKQLSGIV